MSEQTISKDTHNATSSPESADGRLPCASPDGPMTDLFGQVVAPASHSAAPESKKATATSATYGRIGLGSSESAGLQRSLESRLRERLPLDGWMKSLMVWKRKRTPALRQYCQLALSALRTNETDCGLWHTPRAMMIEENVEKFVERMGDRKNTTCPNLAVQVNPAFWPTPRSNEGTGACRAPNATGAPNLRTVAMETSLWKTPKASDGEHGGPNQRGSKGDLALPAQAHHATLWQTPVADDAVERKEGKFNSRGEPKLSAQAIQAHKALWPTATARDHMPAHTPEYIAAKKAQGHGMANLNDCATMWATPSARDWKDTQGMQKVAGGGRMRIDQLPRQIPSHGLSAPTEKPGQLNPAFVCWLMGFPPEWDACAPTAMPSSRRLRPSSLKPVKGGDV